jgi:hypothetical protein
MRFLLARAKTDNADIRLPQTWAWSNPFQGL